MNGEGSWLASRWPIMIFTLGIAASAGIIYNSVGRILILEADLQMRNNILPATQTSNRMDALGVVTASNNKALGELQGDMKSARGDIEELRKEFRAREFWEDLAGRLARLEAADKEDRERDATMRADIRRHEKLDEQMVRQRLSELRAGIKP